MKSKLTSLILAAIMVLSLTGCITKETSSGKVDENLPLKQKIVVVVVDKKTKAPVKDAKVYMMGNETTFTTDEMGKTQEIEIELHKGYFENYAEEVKNSVRAGFVNIFVLKEGYGKHMEMDYSVYPGNSISIAKIEISSGTKATTHYNKPDTSYLENVVKVYENFEGQGNKAEKMVKYKVTVKDENNKPLEGVKIAVPEASLTSKTDKKGICELEIPYNISDKLNYPVKKEYGEITILAYKDGYNRNIVLAAHVKQDSKTNNTQIKMSSSKTPKVDISLCEPEDTWVNSIMKHFK